MWCLLTIVLVILNLLDYQFTAMLIRTGGIEIEANPLAQWVYADYGLAGMILFKLSAVAVTVTIIHIWFSRRGQETF